MSSAYWRIKIVIPLVETWLTSPTNFIFFWDAHGIHLFQIKLCTMRCQITCSLWVYLRLLKVDMFNYVFVCFTAFSHEIISPFIAADALSSIDYKEYLFLLLLSMWCTENCEKNFKHGHAKSWVTYFRLSKRRTTVHL